MVAAAALEVPDSSPHVLKSMAHCLHTHTLPLEQRKEYLIQDWVSLWNAKNARTLGGSNQATCVVSMCSWFFKLDVVGCVLVRDSIQSGEDLESCRFVVPCFAPERNRQSALLSLHKGTTSYNRLGMRSFFFTSDACIVRY